MAVPTLIQRRWVAKSYRVSLPRARSSQSPFERRVRLFCKIVRVGGGFMAALFAFWAFTSAIGVADSATTWALDSLRETIKAATHFLAGGKA